MRYIGNIVLKVIHVRMMSRASAWRSCLVTDRDGGMMCSDSQATRDAGGRCLLGPAALGALDRRHRTARSCRELPASEAIVRPVGAVLAERTDARAEGRCYLGLDVLAHFRVPSCPPPNPRSEPMTYPALTA